jgi:hypothetical protein
MDINVTQIEEWQTIEDINSLENIFMKAQQVLTGGGIVNLIRRYANGNSDKFDELSTLEDLAAYKKAVFKYLG